MASPTFDGSVKNQAWTSASSASASLTTTLTNDMIVVVVQMTHPSAIRTVSSVTSSPTSLSFTKRSAKSIAGTSANIALEVWTAVAASALSSESITVNANSTVDAGSIVAFGVNGVADTASPWDTEAGLPYSTTLSNQAALPSQTFSTSQADDLLLGISSGDKSASYGTAPSGWTLIQAANHFGSSRFSSLGLYYKSVSGAQSSASFAPNGAAVFGALDCTVEVDAMTADTVAVNVDLTAVSAGGAAAGLTPEIDASLSAATSGGAAAALTPAEGVSVTLGAVTAGGEAAAFTPGIDISLVPATGAGAALGIGGGAEVTLGSISAGGMAAAVTAGISVGLTSATAAAAFGFIGDQVQMVGVEAAGAAADLTPRALPTAYLPLFSIMRDTPVAMAGGMDDDPVVMVGTLYPSGPEPRSVAVHLEGVSAGTYASTMTPFYNVDVALTGVEAGGEASDVIGIGNVV